MHIEGSSISCGVRRLVIGKDEAPNSDQLSGLLRSNKGGCAVVITGISPRRKEITAMLTKCGFERISDKAKQVIIDASVKTEFANMAFLLRHHGNEYDVDDTDSFEHFVGATIDNSLTDMATMIMHHGSFAGSLDFYICYMSKVKN